MEGNSRQLEWIYINAECKDERDHASVLFLSLINRVSNIKRQRKQLKTNTLNIYIYRRTS